MKTKAKIFLSFMLIVFLFVSNVNIGRAQYSINLDPEAPALSTVENNANSSAVTAAGDVIWYQNSNDGVYGGSLPDFLHIFSTAYDSQWPYSRGRTSVFYAHREQLTQLENTSPGFIENTLVPFLLRNNLRLALDSTTATGASCRTASQNAPLLNNDLDIIRRVESAGGQVSYITSESMLSWFACSNYTLVQRENDISWYVSQIKAAFPNGPNRHIKYGIIDSLLAEGESISQTYFGLSVANAYSSLVTYENNHGTPLEVFVIDHPVEYFSDFEPGLSSSMQKLIDTKNFFKSNGAIVGMFLTSAYSSSEAQFTKNILYELEYMHNEIGKSIFMDFYVISSWYANIPSTELPETPAPANLNTHYPMTRNLKIMSQYILTKMTTMPPAAPGGLVVM